VVDAEVTRLTAALERQFGGEVQVDKDDDGGVTVLISGANGTWGYSVGPGPSAFLRYGLGIEP
jgi:hypothetical protein